MIQEHVQQLWFAGYDFNAKLDDIMKTAGRWCSQFLGLSTTFCILHGFTESVINWVCMKIKSTTHVYSTFFSPTSNHSPTPPFISLCAIYITKLSFIPCCMFDMKCRMAMSYKNYIAYSSVYYVVCYVVYSTKCIWQSMSKCQHQISTFSTLYTIELALYAIMLY